MACLNWLIKCIDVKLSTVYHQPGISPRPPTLEPTPSAPLRPNSTATRPKGSSRDGISANSAPLKIYGGKAVNSGFENTRPGNRDVSFSSFFWANLPYRSMTGPTQINWVFGLSSRTEKNTSAMMSIPFCIDHRPTKTKSSACF